MEATNTEVITVFEMQEEDYLRGREFLKEKKPKLFVFSLLSELRILRTLIRAHLVVWRINSFHIHHLLYFKALLVLRFAARKEPAALFQDNKNVRKMKEVEMSNSEKSNNKIFLPVLT